MRRIYKAGICIAAAAMVISGCGGKNTDTTKETTAAETAAVLGTRSEEEVTDEASITLGAYKDLELTMEKAVVSDNELSNQLNYIKGMYPDEEDITGRPAQEGDTAIIDYEGTREGVAFAGGTDTDAELKLGSGQFIEGFEEGVVGMEIGDEKDLNLTFPDPYSNNPDLAGKEVVFHVKLNGLKEVKETELDDALAKRALEDESATLETLKSQLYDQLMQQKERDAFYETGNQALMQVIENSEITCDPDAVDEMYEQLQTTYTSYASQYGMELGDFLSLFMGTDLDGLKENAKNLVEQQMVLDEIIALEKITATDEQKENLAKVNQFDSAAALVVAYGQENADRLFTMEAAYHFLIDNAKVTMVDSSEVAAQASLEAAESDAAGSGSAETEVVETAESGAETKGTETAESGAETEGTDAAGSGAGAEGTETTKQ